MKMRLTILFMVVLMLSGCGYKEGDTLTLKDSILGGDTIRDYQEAKKKALETGKFEVDGIYTNMMFKGDKVLVIDKNDRTGMVLIKVLDGADEDTKWRVEEEDLK